MILPKCPKRDCQTHLTLDNTDYIELMHQNKQLSISQFINKIIDKAWAEDEYYQAFQQLVQCLLNDWEEDKDLLDADPDEIVIVDLEKWIIKKEWVYIWPLLLFIYM